MLGNGGLVNSVLFGSCVKNGFCATPGETGHKKNPKINGLQIVSQKTPDELMILEKRQMSF